MLVAFIYLCSIVGVNFGFAHTVPFDTPLGPVPPMTLFVGIVFVLRDFVQREIGHKVLLVMLLGCALSFWMANPFIATASLTAFVAAEAADWGIYTFIPGKFQHKVLYSSLIGVLVDTLVFLPMIGMFSWSAVLAMYLSKMVAAVAVFLWFQYKDHSRAIAETA